MIVEDTQFDFESDDDDLLLDNAVEVDHNVGIDLDLIGGYDFGGFRVEAELGYKSASLDAATISGQLLDSADFTGEIDGDARVLSAMVNGLFDFGDDDGWSGYVGGGVGLASIKYNLEADEDGDVNDNDGAFAWQVIAGVRKAVSDNVDLGLKYRFFATTAFKYGDDVGGELEGKWRSHSLLLSLIYNFAPPPPPPPPPPPEPERG